MQNEQFFSLLEKYKPARLDSERQTPAQRLLAALHCGLPDRVPVCLPGFNLYAWADESYLPVLEALVQCGNPIYDLYLGYEPLVRLPEALSTTETLPDGRLLQTVGTPRGPLSQVVSPFAGQTNHPNRVKHWIETLEDAERFIEAPFALPPRDFNPIRRNLDRMAGYFPTIVTINEPMECINGLMGTTNFCLWSLEQPALIQTILEVLFDQIIAELELLLAYDWEPVYRISGCEMVTPPLMSLRSYFKYSQPYQKKMVERIRRAGRPVIIHAHSKVAGLLDAFADLGAQGTDPCEPPPIGNLDLAWAKQKVNNRFSLWGNIEYTELTDADEPRIAGLVCQALGQGSLSGGFGGGFVLMPCARLYKSTLTRRAQRNMLCYLATARDWNLAHNIERTSGDAR